MDVNQKIKDAAVSDGQQIRRPVSGRQLTFRYLWLIFGAFAVIAFGAIWALLPHEREGQTLWEFVAKIIAFIFAIAAVSTFPQRFRGSYLVAAAPFVVFLSFIIPRMTYYFLMGPKTEPIYYTYLWSLDYPAILLSVALAYRLGGGSFGHCVKIGLSGLILVFSGFLELMWFVVNPLDYYDLPSVPHVEVIIGHFPSRPELVVFALCHIPLLLIVNLLPLDRWYDRFLGVPAGGPPVSSEV